MTSRAFLLFFTLAAVGLCAAAQGARAEPKPWIWSWGAGHFKDQDFRPHTDHPKHPHNTQWMDRAWQPTDWIRQSHSAMEVIRDFYRADIIRGQHLEDRTPVLVVGPGFYHLGGYDKRRVTRFLDYVYEVTDKDPGIFRLIDWNTRKPVGVYTRLGLQLQ